MKRWWRAPASVLLVASMLLATFPTARAAAAASEPTQARLPAPEASGITLPSTGQVIVKFRKPEAAASLMAVAAKGGQVRSQGNPTRVVVRLPKAPDQARAMVKALRTLPGVVYVENDERMKALDVPSDPKWGDLWGVQRIHADQAWATVGTNPTTVTVAVVDTGVDAEHQDLAGQVLSGYNAIYGAPDTTDTADGVGHGTHVSGTIAGVYDNGIGVTGVVGPANVKILPVKVLGDDGYGTNSDVAAGIEWAADNGANVINLSLGGYYSQAVADAVRYAADRGVVVVAAAGNEHANTAQMAPAGVPGAFTVSAVDSAAKPASFSNFGAEVEVAAPGVGIWSTVPGDRYESYNGTSMATPHVAAVAALVKAAHPEYTRAEIQGCLVSSAEPVSAITAQYGAGLVRADLAVACDATALPDTYAFKLESPNTTQPLRGVTTFTFETDPARVATITVTDNATNAELGTASVTQDLMDVAVDLSDFVAGEVTLTATALDSNGVTVGTVTGTYRVAGPSYVIRMRDENGAPAPGANVAVYVEYIDRWYDDTDPYWEYVDTLSANADGVVALSNATIPGGHRVMVKAWTYDAEGHPVYRYGIANEPGVLDLNAEVVLTTVDASAVPVQSPEFMLMPHSEEEYSPMWLYPNNGSSMGIWLPAGDYVTALDSQGDKYYLVQHASVSPAADTIAFDLTNTAEITWQPTAGRTYDGVSMTLFTDASHWGTWYDVADLANGDSMVVKQGNYRVYLDVALLDRDGGWWSYSFSSQPVTVGASGATVKEGTPKQAIGLSAPKTVTPGQAWRPYFSYSLEEGGYLYDVYYESGTRDLAKAQPGTIRVAQERPGRAPREWLLDTAAKSPVLTAGAGAKYSDTMYPTVEIRNSNGKTVVTPDDLDIDFSSATWDVPFSFPTGTYRAAVSLNAGPLGKLGAEKQVVVGQDTVTSGALVKVTDAQGKPVSGADVTLLQPFAMGNGHNYWNPFTHAETNWEGFARLDGSGMRLDVPVKLAVQYEDDWGYSYTIVKDVTLPRTVTVSLGEAHPVTVRPTDESGDAVVDETEVGVAYVDENGDAIVVDYGATYQGAALFNLGPGKVRFTATDSYHQTFTAGKPTAITASTTTVDLPAGELSYLSLDEGNQFADGSPALPLIALAEPAGGLPGRLVVGFFGSPMVWKVTPGIYDHFGEYLREWQDQQWTYDLAGGEVVEANGHAMIPVGGTFSAEIGSPSMSGNAYFFPVQFLDSYHNRLFAVYSAEISDLSAQKEALATAIKRHDLRALRSNPAVKRLEQRRLMAMVGQQASLAAGAKAQYEPDISPILSVQDDQGTEVWRDTSSSNWYQAAYFAATGAEGTYTARIALGVGPEGSLAATVPFEVARMTLSVSPTLFNPKTGKLTVSLQLPGTDTYSIQIQDAQGVKVKSLTTNMTGLGISMVWDGKNDSGKLVANGNYRVAATTTKYGSSTASFRLRTPLEAKKPVVSAEKSLVNTNTATLTGTTTAGFGLTAQVKGPGQTEWTAANSLGFADDKGAFSIAAPLLAGDGAYQVQVRSFDPDDTQVVSAWSSTVNVTRDTVAPDLTLLSPKVFGNAVWSNSFSLTLTGTSDPGAAVQVAVSQPGVDPVITTGKADTKGNWKVDKVAVFQAATLTLTATDLAGNLSEPQSYLVGIDREAPGIVTGDDGKPGISFLVERDEESLEVRPVVDKTGLTYTASGAGANGFALRIETTEPVETVKVSPAVKDLQPVMIPDGVWLPIAPKANGSTTYSIDIYDQAGNKTTLPKVYVKLDSNGPQVTISKPTGTTVLAANGETVATVTLEGTANEVLGALKVIDTASPETDLDTVVAVNGKNFTAKVNLPLIEAQYELRVVGYDLAGNRSTPGSKEFRTVKVDVTAPAVPELTAPMVYDGNLYVTANTAALKGTAEPGVTVYARVGTAAPVKTTASSSGAFSLTAKFTGNTADLTLWAVDAAGNASDEALFTLNYDKTPATVSDLVLLVGDQSYALMETKGKWSYPDGTINVGAADSVALVGSSNDPVTAVTVNGKTVPLESGPDTFGVVLTGLVKGGANSLTLKVIDRAGNTASVSVSFALDAPKATVAEKDAVTKTGGGTYTFNITYSEAMQHVQVIPTLIEGDAGELQITSQPPVTAPTYESPTKWKVQVTLPETGTGVWTLQFLGTDRQGNTTAIGSAGQDTRRITLDTSAPAIAMTGTWEPVMLTSMATFPVQGRVTDFGAGLKSLTVNGSTVAVDSEGRFLKSVKVNEGVTKIEVKATDLVGNVTTTTTQLVRKSKISTLNVSKSGPTGGKLTISGSTDKPVVVNGAPVVSVAVQIMIKGSDGTVLMILDPVTVGADGKYSVTGVDVSGLGKGTYTIEVTARVPEFLLIKKATTTFTVN